MLPYPPVIVDDPPGRVLNLDLTGQVVLTCVKGRPYLWDVLERSPLGLLVRDDLDLQSAHTVLESLGSCYAQASATCSSQGFSYVEAQRCFQTNAAFCQVVCSGY